MFLLFTRLKLLLLCCRGTEGGGVYAHTFDSPFFITMVNTTLSQNFAMTGGACLFRGGEVQLGAGVVISRNTASQEAGGLGWFSGCLGSGLCPSKVKVSCDAVIENNTASVAGGGRHLVAADICSCCSSEGGRGFTT